MAWALSVGACAHHQATRDDQDDRAALEAKAREDLGPDPMRELDAGAPPPAPRPPPVVEAPPAPDPRKLDEAALRSASLGRDCPAIHAAIEAHPGASPAAVREALGAAERCEQRAKDLAAARKTARELLLACGPEAVDRCRARALALMKKLANQKPKEPSLAARARELAEKDACVVKLERQARGDAPLDACAASADAVYRSQRDLLMRARIKLAKARHAARSNDPAAQEKLEQAAEACLEPRCAGVRTRALDALAAWATAQKKPELVLAARLKQDAIAAESLPPERRPYSRSPRTDAACAALDSAQQPGACRALEKRVTGTWTFHDWSLQEVPGDLPPEPILRANDDFAVTLQECFRDEAARLPVPSTATYKVRWMVTNAGRADQVHLDPPANDEGPLARCLRHEFTGWRYPRSHGEDQHVEQGFTISARPR